MTAEAKDGTVAFVTGGSLTEGAAARSIGGVMRVKMPPTRKQTEGHAHRLLRLIEAGLQSGIHKCQKYDMLPDLPGDTEDGVISILRNYIFNNIDEEYDLYEEE